MNRNFRTVWNEGTQSWSVVSELAKGRSKSSSSSTREKFVPSGKKVFASLALVSALGLQTMSAMAYTSEVEASTVFGETVTGVQTVKNGGIAQDGTVTGSGAIQNVEAGGQAIAMTLQTNGVQNILAAGVAVDTVIKESGSQNINNNGVSHDTRISSTGKQNVNSGGVAYGTIIRGASSAQTVGQFVNDGGVAWGTQVWSAGHQTIALGGIANNAVIDASDGNVIAYQVVRGVANSTTLGESGHQNVLSGGVVYDTTVQNGAGNTISGQFVRDGGRAERTTISSGKSTINSGGTSIGVEVNDAGTLIVENGGNVENVSINNNGMMRVDNTTAGTVKNVVVNNGGLIRVVTNARFDNVILNGSALMNSMSSSFRINVQQSLAFNQIVDYDFAADIIGAGGVIKNNTNTITLTGTNTYGGGTVVNAGTLRGNISLNGPLTVANGANYVNYATTNQTIGGAFSGAGTIEQAGTGTLTVTGAASGFTGSFVVLDGVLRGSASAFGAGNIANNKNVVFDEAASGTYSGLMTGTGHLEKVGAGTSILTGANTYAGGTTVTEGTLQGNTTSLQGNIHVAAATELAYNQTGIALANSKLKNTLSGTGTIATAATNAGTLLVGDLNVSNNAIVHRAGSLHIEAGKTLSAGDMSIKAGAILGMTGDSQPAINAKSVVFDAGSIVKVLGFNGPSTNTYTLMTTANGITDNGFVLDLGGGGGAVGLDVYQVSSVTLTNAGKDLTAGYGLVWNNTTAGGAHGTFNIADGASVTISETLANRTGAVLGNGWDGTSLTKTGAGTLTLTGTNAYTGGTTVTAGTLQGTTGSIKGNLLNNAN
ncbi:MAG: autotransporter-associated beta strand repeat-containing protein, partial [Saezia sp.]